MSNIPLKVLVIDPNDSSAGLLVHAMEDMSQAVLSIKRIVSLEKAQILLTESDINTIYIDPLSFHLNEVSDFILNVRKLWPSIVFVLYVDVAHIEHNRNEFYKDERRRFSHYYRLDKLTPLANFADELKATIRACQGYLSYTLSKDKITNLQEELKSIQKNTSAEIVSMPMKIIIDIQEQLEALKNQQHHPQPEIKPKTVFLSYRFSESEYVDGLRTLLEREGFSIITGRDTNSYISQAILERIKSCEFFLSLMTKADEKKDGTFTISPWVLEEKGAALAIGKRIVLLVEEGVSDIGGLQGDWQRIYFTSKSFTKAAIRAIDQLKSYGGQSV